jgi:hypothetical protein
MSYKEAIQLLANIGLVDVILPFILVFTITFGILQRSKVLGEEDKEPKVRLNAMVAFVLGFFAVLSVRLLNVVNVLLAYMVLFLVVGLLFALIFGLAGAQIGSKNKVLGGIIGALFVLFLIYGLVQAGVIDKARFVNTLLLPALVLGALVFVVYYLLKREPAEEVHQQPGRPQMPMPQGRGPQQLPPMMPGPQQQQRP